MTEVEAGVWEHEHQHSHNAPHSHRHRHVSKPTLAHERSGMGSHAHKHSGDADAPVGEPMRRIVTNAPVAHTHGIVDGCPGCEAGTPWDAPVATMTEQLRALSEAATPGPWMRRTEGNASVEQLGHKLLHDLLVPLPDDIPPSTDATYILTADGSKNVAFIGNGSRQTENGDFIVAAVNYVRERLAAATSSADAGAGGPATRLTLCEERERDLRQALLEGSYFHVTHEGKPRHPETCHDCRRLAEEGRIAQEPR